MSGLRLSRGLVLPLDVAGEAVGILAKRGAGKTNTAKVLVEELLDQHVQVVVLDPVGVWWGLRSSSAGGEGYPIAVLGGEHGDVPLEAAAGALIADVVVESGQPLVLDVSEFSKTEQRRFLADFATRLYRRKARARSVLHVVLEEADEFAPQRVNAGDAPMVGAISLIVKRGRSRGLGLTFVTQRSASLNKDVLDQADVLVVMRTIGPRDRKAIEGWIEHQDADGADQVLPSLPSLDTGEAWVWNPERGMLVRSQIRKARTFDSSATPKAGAKKAEPTSIAPIDLAALGTRIKETAERVKASDPRLLQQRVRQLERELAERPETVETNTIEVRVPIEVPVLSEEDIARVEEQIADAREIATQIEGLPSALRATAEQITAALARVASGRQLVEQGERREVSPRRESVAARPPARRPAQSADTDGLTSSQLKVLGALAWLESIGIEQPDKIQVGFASTYSPNSGNFNNLLGQLRSLGYLHYPAPRLVTLTDQGREVAPHVDRPESDDELRRSVLDKLKGPQAKVLRRADRALARRGDATESR